MKSQATILLFKTNFTHENHLLDLKFWLDQHPSVSAWNIDLEDCDNVLRIISENMMPSDVIQYVRQLGFMCEELE